MSVHICFWGGSSLLLHKWYHTDGFCPSHHVQILTHTAPRSRVTQTSAAGGSLGDAQLAGAHLQKGCYVLRHLMALFLPTELRLCFNSSGFILFQVGVHEWL